MQSTYVFGRMNCFVRTPRGPHQLDEDNAFGLSTVSSRAPESSCRHDRSLLCFIDSSSSFTLFLPLGNHVKSGSLGTERGWAVYDDAFVVGAVVIIVLENG